MKLAFVDESGDEKFKDYLGVCVAVIDSTHYRTVRDGLHSVLREKGWDESIEFKGAYLFSANKGDSRVSVEDRIDIVSSILDLCSAKHNARVTFTYVHGDAEKAKATEAYLSALAQGLEKALTKPSGKVRGDKPLLYLSCDQRSDVSPSKIEAAIRPSIQKRGFSLLEAPVVAVSEFRTAGILLADIVAYLAARIATISNDSELFEDLTEEQLETNGKVRKLRASTELLEKVKRIDWHDHKAT